MIIVLNNKDTKTANDILEVQLPAYRVEAEIIGFDDIPPLRDTVQSIVDCDEHFVAYVLDEAVAGFISYEQDDNDIHICRLVVHPNYFRKGIAKQLLAHVLRGPAEGKKIVVHTGAKNVPAIRLYVSYGFEEMEHIEVAPEVYITRFERPTSRNFVD
ncbi:N-acetyltransferase [Paenibacillus sp. L3-i20]|uniref:GNAT family N-acetyltransferase n=1 Tax=Paenibacillus sp. L3-i20 TaxID=2905833 RepID=UPI001EDD63C4|nr:GNAT family N-acetyltransferase [Paenibacillus sp. L3-i20]GKU76372.1 hypothetical protein L3i20_v207690 [Paenibacillus sp. L3-i20]